MRKFSITEKLVAGIGTIVAGILIFFGERIGEWLLNLTPTVVPSSVSSTSNIVASVIIIIGIVIILYALYTIRTMKQGLDLRREENRPQIEVLLNEAERNSTVWVMGIDCTYWLDDCGKIVKEYVTGHDLSFIFLVAKPDSVILETASEAGFISTGSKARIESSISLFQKMRSELGEKGGKIQLGIYDLPIVHSMVVVNPSTPTERMQVTHHLCKVPWVDRPNLTLRKQFLTSEQQRVFDGYHDSVKNALESTRDLDGKRLVV